MILGDFIIDYTKYNSINEIKHYADNITSLGCDQLVAVPTKITTRCQSLLDHIYVNDSMLTDIQPSAVYVNRVKLLHYHSTSSTKANIFMGMKLFVMQ